MNRQTKFRRTGEPNAESAGKATGAGVSERDAAASMKPAVERSWLPVRDWSDCCSIFAVIVHERTDENSESPARPAVGDESWQKNLRAERSRVGAERRSTISSNRFLPELSPSHGAGKLSCRRHNANTGKSPRTAGRSHGYERPSRLGTAIASFIRGFATPSVGLSRRQQEAANSQVLVRFVTSIRDGQLRQRLAHAITARQVGSTWIYLAG